jgi:hypothetical protein
MIGYPSLISLSDKIKEDKVLKIQKGEKFA